MLLRDFTVTPTLLPPRLPWGSASSTILFSCCISKPFLVRDMFLSLGNWSLPTYSAFLVAEDEDVPATISLLTTQNDAAALLSTRLGFGLAVLPYGREDSHVLSSPPSPGSRTRATDTLAVSACLC